MTASLEGLPAELLARVVHYVPRPADLKSLCVTSKTLRDTALPKLYRRIVLKDGRGHWPKLQLGRGLLSADNAGLPHLRRLYCGSDHTSEPTLEAASLRTLLQYLPRDGLTHLRFFYTSMDEATVVALLTQQKRLKHLAIGPLDFDLNHHLQAGAFQTGVWSSLETLVLPRILGSLQDLNAFRHIIQSAPRLSSLEICATYVQRPTKLRLADHAGGDPLFDMLFPQSTGSTTTSHQRLKLHKLELDYVPLRSVMNKFEQIFDIHSLRKLCIYSCRDWFNLLPMLASAFAKHGSSLRTFRLNVLYLYNEPVQQLLRSVQNLQSLRLVGEEWDGGIALEAFNEHLGSLEELVMLDGYDGVDLQDTAVQRLCSTIAKRPQT